MKHSLLILAHCLFLLALDVSAAPGKLLGFNKLDGLSLQAFKNCPLSAGLTPKVNRYAILEVLADSDPKGYVLGSQRRPGVKVRVLSNPQITHSSLGGLAEEECEGMLLTDAVVIPRAAGFQTWVSDAILQRSANCPNQFVDISNATVEILSLPIERESSIMDIKIRVLTNMPDSRRFAGIGCEGFVSASDLSIRNLYTTSGRAMLKGPQVLLKSPMCDGQSVGENSEVVILNRPEGAEKLTRVRVFTNTDSSEIRAEEGCEGYVSDSKLDLSINL